MGQPINTNITVGTSATVVSLEKGNEEREAIILTNVSTAGQVITIAIGEEAKAGKGIVLGVGSQCALSMDAGFKPPQQAITAIADGANASLAVFELVRVA